jgi:adhesin transport system membrane fusion protein
MNILKKIGHKVVTFFSTIKIFFAGLFRKKNKEAETNGESIKEFRLFPNVQAEDLDFITDSKAALLTKSTPIAGIILYSILTLLLILIVWSYFATIEQLTIGLGKVIPSSEVKIIQSLDGGIISSIDVKEGEIIKKNHRLIEFDNTRYKSDFDQAREKYFSLKATIARLSAEIKNSNKIDFPQELQLKHQDLIATETSLFQAKQKALQQELAVLQKNYDLAASVLKIYEPLLKNGVVPKIDYYKAQQAANEIQRSMLTINDKYREDALTELGQRKADLAVITESITSLKDKMQRTIIYSPVTGIVKKLYIHTIGAVIQSGQPILEIVPMEDSLLVQVKVKPADIAFIEVGQDATVKITAYDYSVYGSLPGKVEYISADTMEEKANVPQDELNYYLVNVRTDKSYLGTKKYKLPIMSGMKAMVYIKTGNKTVLEYLLKPLIKAKQESLRER